MKLNWNVNILFKVVKLMKNDLYQEDNSEIFGEDNEDAIDFKEVLMSQGFNDDTAEYILKSMYNQSYINPLHWESYCNMNRSILKLKQENPEEFEKCVNEFVNKINSIEVAKEMRR